MGRKEKFSETRQRLLEVAGEVFAERGFREATIREICERAKANVASINYHFGDKEALYRSVFDCLKSNVPRLDDPKFSGLPAEERLHTFVEQILTGFFGEGRPTWFAKLMAHEMTEPTKVLDGLVKHYFSPNVEKLREIVRELIGGKVSESTQMLCVFSIVAQWVFYFISSNVVRRLNTSQRFEAKDIEQLADHITRFSVSALRNWKSADV